MLHFKALIAFLPLVALVAAHNPQPSNPPCTYSCPDKDTHNGGGWTYSSMSTNGDTLTCKYRKPNDNDNNYCSYYKTTGQLFNGNHCQSSAVCNRSSKRGLDARRKTFDARANKARVNLAPEVKATIEKRKNLRAAKHDKRNRADKTA